MSPTVAPRSPTTLSAQLARVGAEQRLRRELYAVALDLIGVADPEMLGPGERAHLAQALAPASDRAVEAALAALVPAVEGVLSTLPESFAPRLAALRAAHDCGHF